MIKRTGIVLGVLFLICSLTVGAVFLFVIKRPSHSSDFNQTELGKWNRIDLGDNTISADGSEYYVFTKRGKQSAENNWMIYLSGGGMNWDETSTAEPITLKTMLKGEGLTYFANIPFYKLTMMKGILEEDNESNPFANWNYLYIPYSTGDFHIGNNSVEYSKNGKTYESYHNGRNNVLAALEWFQQNSGTPSNILICGESAGGFGAAFWTPYIAEIYTETRIFEYTDSSYIQTGRWKDIIDSHWNADFKGNYGFEPEADLITVTFAHNALTYPDITFLQSNTLYDNLLINFQKRLNDNSLADSEYRDIWSAQMLASTKLLADKYSNYHFFITDYSLDSKLGTTVHTLSSSEDFYKANEDGINLCDWLYSAIESKDVKNVGSDFLSK